MQSTSDLCCPPPGDACVCTLDCAVAFVPLLRTCRAALDAFLDVNDGSRDGVDTQLDDLSAQCHALPKEAIIQQLRDMRDAGTCPDSFLNNVAVANVTDSVCTDSRPSCDTLITAGVTCSESIMVRGCQATCGLCNGHRRAQLASACPLSDFEQRAAVVNAACCDDGKCSGVPNRCDAKCAIEYNPFFDDCSNLLTLQLPAPDVVKYNQLHTTCATELPIDGLIDALVHCRSVVQCSSLPEQEGMTITLSNGNISPSTATYTCDATGGPPVDGDPTRTCQPSGRWSGKRPSTCEVLSCRFTAVTGSVSGMERSNGGYRCVERDGYVDDESGSWGVARPGIVTVESFETEACCDHVQIAGSPAEDGQYSGGWGDSPTFEVTTDTTFSWATDGSVTGGGFRMCCDE